MVSSELDYIDDFLSKVHTTYTVETIQTTRNIANIGDTQAILVYSGEIVSTTMISVIKQHKIQYWDATEEALNTAIYALIEGVRKLNAREAITSYTKPNALIGIQIISSGKDYYNIKSGVWSANSIKIEVEWLTI